MSLAVYDLHDLPKTRLNGQTAFLSDRQPAVRLLRNVLYVPPAHSLRDGDWGLLDEQDHIVVESVPQRGGRDSGDNIKPSLFNQKIDRIPDRNSVRYYAGSHYYLGFSAGHFGEFLVETLAKLWAYASFADAISRVVVHRHASTERFFDSQPYARAVLEAAGVHADQIFACRSPALFETMIVPESAFVIRGHVFPEMFDLTRNIGCNILRQQGATAASDQPLYLSRAHLAPGFRRLNGEAEVEYELGRRGAKIFHPEVHTITEQIRIINAHDVVAGMVGSALHLLLFSLTRKTVVYFEPREWTSANYPMIDKAMGHSSKFYFLDIPQPSGHPDYSPRDPEDLGMLIDALIRDLGL